MTKNAAKTEAHSFLTKRLFEHLFENASDQDGTALGDLYDRSNTVILETDRVIHNPFAHLWNQRLVGLPILLAKHEPDNEGFLVVSLTVHEIRSEKRVSAYVYDCFRLTSAGHEEFLSSYGEPWLLEFDLEDESVELDCFVMPFSVTDLMLCYLDDLARNHNWDQVAPLDLQVIPSGRHCGTVISH